MSTAANPNARTVIVTCERGRFGRECTNQTTCVIIRPDRERLAFCATCVGEMWKVAQATKAPGWSLEPIYHPVARRKAPKTAGKSIRQLAAELGSLSGGPGKQYRYYSAAETAILIRATLAARFPGIKFRVTSKTYSGGASARVRWDGGPSYEDVRKVAGQFSGSTFDSMQDLKSYNDSELFGMRVHFGADYVFCERDR